MEWQVLLTAVRARHLAPDAAALPGLLRAHLDWEKLIRLAHDHATLPLLHRALRSVDASLIPVAARSQLQAHFQTNALHNLRLAGELARLAKVFHTQGVPFLAFKGSTLALAAYGDLSLRQFNDLDLLLPDPAIARALDLLAERGYRPADALSPPQQAAQLASIGQLALHNAQGDCLLELHNALLPRAFAFRLSGPALWRRAESVAVGGTSVPTLGGEDLLLYLCAHGAKHLWASLGWIVDIAELLRARPGLCGDRLLQRATSLGGRRMMLLGLRLAELLCGLPLEPAQRLAVEREPHLEELADRVVRRLLQPPARQELGLESVRFHLRVRERPRDGLRYGLSLIFQPTVADWETASLPGLLHYALRPVRLARKYLGRKRR